MIVGTTKEHVMFVEIVLWIFAIFGIGALVLLIAFGVAWYYVDWNDKRH